MQPPLRNLIFFKIMTPQSIFFSTVNDFVCRKLFGGVSTIWWREFSLVERICFSAEVSWGRKFSLINKVLFGGERYLFGKKSH